MGEIFVDKYGYLRERSNVLTGPSTLIHRKLAHEYIYLPNRDKYPLPFNEYVVHHIDHNKQNNRIDNLMILTPAEHDKIHGIQHPPESVREDGHKIIYSPESTDSSGIDYLPESNSAHPVIASFLFVLTITFSVMIITAYASNSFILTFIVFFLVLVLSIFIAIIIWGT